MPNHPKKWGKVLPESTERLYLSLQNSCENSSVGRAQPCQGWGREFESRFSLQSSTFGPHQKCFFYGLFDKLTPIYAEAYPPYLIFKEPKIKTSDRSIFVKSQGVIQGLTKQPSDRNYGTNQCF